MLFVSRFGFIERFQKVINQRYLAHQLSRLIVIFKICLSLLLLYTLLAFPLNFVQTLLDHSLLLLELIFFAGIKTIQWRRRTLLERCFELSC